MLELLARFKSIWIGHWNLVNLCHVRETIHYEGSHQDSTRYLIIFYGQTIEGCENLQLRYLNKTVYIVVREDKFLEFLESLKLWEVWMTYYILKAYILKANLFDCLLEICIIKDF